MALELRVEVLEGRPLRRVGLGGAGLLDRGGEGCALALCDLSLIHILLVPTSIRALLPLLPGEDCLEPLDDLLTLARVQPFKAVDARHPLHEMCIRDR